VWVYHGQRKWIFPLAWKLNIDIEIEHFACTGVWNGLTLHTGGVVGSGIPVWMADGWGSCVHMDR
jgi:hypothetical protein